MTAWLIVAACTCVTLPAVLAAGLAYAASATPPDAPGAERARGGEGR